MERMKLTEKEKDQIVKRGAEAMSKIIERMSIEMGELEEENKKLKAEKDKLYIDYENLSNCNADLIQENKKLKEIIRKNVNGCPYGGFYCSQYLGL